MKRLVAILLLIIACAGVLGVTATAVWYLRPKPVRVLTDGATVELPADQAAPRDVLWGRAERIPGPVNTSGGDDAQPAVSPDGLLLVFTRGAPGANTDLYAARRVDSGGRSPAAAGWGAPEPIAALNSPADELAPAFGPDGATLYFTSDRAGGAGGYDLWRSIRGPEGWSTPINLGPAVNGVFHEVGAAVSASGDLYFASNRSDEPMSPELAAKRRRDPEDLDYDIHVARSGADGWTPATVVAALASPHQELAPALAPSGGVLYFASDRPGGRGGFDLYRARLRDGGFLPPHGLGDTVNSPHDDIDPAIGLAGFAVYFTSNRPFDETGEAADFDLHVAVSSEVYAATRFVRSDFNWRSFAALLAPLLLWLLLGLLALLATWIYGVNGKWKTLNLLARCILASMLVHLLLLLTFTFWGVAAPIMDYVRESTGTRIVMVSGARPNDLAGQLRGGLTAPRIETDPEPSSRLQQAPSPNRSDAESVELSAPAPDAAAEASLAAAPAREAEPQPPETNPATPQAVEQAETVATAAPLAADRMREHETDVAPAESAERPSTPRTARSARPGPAPSSAVELTAAIDTPADASVAEQAASDTAAPSASAPAPRADAPATETSLDAAEATPAMEMARRATGSEAQADTPTPDDLGRRASPATEAPGAPAPTPTVTMTPAQGDAPSQPLFTEISAEDGAAPQVQARQPSPQIELAENATASLDVPPLPAADREVSAETHASPTIADRAVQRAGRAPVAEARDALVVAETADEPAIDSPAPRPLAETGAQPSAAPSVSSLEPAPADADGLAITPIVLATPPAAMAERGAGGEHHAEPVETALASGPRAARTAQAQPRTTGEDRADVVVDPAPADLPDATTLSGAAGAPAAPSSAPEAAAGPPAAVVLAERVELELSTPARATATGGAETTAATPGTQALASAGRAAPASAADHAAATTLADLGPAPVATLAPAGSIAAAIVSDAAIAVGLPAPDRDASVPAPLTDALVAFEGEAGPGRAEMVEDAPQSITSPSPRGARAARAPADRPTPTAPAVLAPAAAIDGTPADRSLAAGEIAMTRAEATATPTVPIRVDAPPPIYAVADVMLPPGETEPDRAGPGSKADHDTAPARIAGARRASPAPLASRRADEAPPLVPVAPMQRSGSSLVAPDATDAPPAPLLAAATDRPRLDPTRDLPRSTILPPLQVPTEIEPPSPYRARAPERRAELVEKHGGSRKTEQAVERALAWLAGQQMPDGHWSSRRLEDTSIKSDIAITGLSMLCFMAADHTHAKPGPYRDTMRRAVDWLLEQSDDRSGNLMRDESMYSHGIASLALTEAYGMTKDERLRRPGQLAIGFIDRARNHEVGGWRYGPGQIGDTSVTGWQLMALKSAERAGLDIPYDSVDAVGQWLRLVSLPTRPGLYAYRPGEPYSPAMTAEAMYCEQLLGADRNDHRTREAARYILENPPSWDEDSNTYYWYYATLGMFNHGGDDWDRWNAQMRRELVGNQRTDGRMAGSWDPEGRWASIGGRVYQTCMACLSLEVYYRYLPLYDVPFGE